MQLAAILVENSIALLAKVCHNPCLGSFMVLIFEQCVTVRMMEHAELILQIDVQ